MRVFFIFSITLFCLQGIAQDQEMLKDTLYSNDSLLTVSHYQSQSYKYISKIEIKRGNKTILLNRKELLKNKRLSCNNFFECEYPLRYLPKIENIIDFPEDIILIKGKKTKETTFHHLIFLDQKTNTILKWIVYNAYMKDISHSFFRYDSKTTTIILSKTENFIWENQIYIIDYYNNNFSHVHPIKRKEKFIEVGKAYYYSGLFPILKPEENDLFFEIKIKGQSK